jgi:predicted nucleic acid-binding protein
VRLVVKEAESGHLRRWLAARSEVVRASSGIARTELLRAVRRGAPSLVDLAQDVLATVHLVAVTPTVLHDAATVEPPALRTLDAIHLATARRIAGDLDAFVGYDERLLDAARSLGLRVASPA